MLRAQPRYNGANGMSDMAGGVGITTWEECVAVECGGRRRDTNLLQSEIREQGRPVPNRAQPTDRSAESSGPNDLFYPSGDLMLYVIHV
jgi:hypothetical protein